MRSARLIALTLLLAAACMASSSSAGNNGVKAGTITCSTTATQIVAVNLSRLSLDVVTIGSTTAFLGASDVTAAAGFQLEQNARWAATVPFKGALFCIVTSGTSEIRYMETSD